MKGVIIKAIEKLVIKISDIETWEKILVEAGFDKNTVFLMNNDISDDKILNIISVISEILNIEPDKVFDAFGDFWINDFTSDIYSPFYEGINDAKTFLKQLDSIHVEITNMIPNAKPPRFTYEEPDEKTLIVTYVSERSVVNLFVSISKGLIKRYNETVEIIKISETKIKFIWE